MKLLTPAHANAKTAKNSMHTAYISYILHLAPFNLSGVNVCPAASKGCAAACLNTAGRGAFNSVQAARIKKTKMFFERKTEFFALLVKDLQAVQRKADKLGLKAVVRLNGTSDLQWELMRVNGHQNIFEMFPRIQFYDYTKIIRRLERFSANPLPNYHLTFSRAEDNEDKVKRAIELGYNVAAVFAGPVPETFLGVPTVDGDSHDFRFLDQPKSIVALKAKGKARKDTSGFVVSACSTKAAA